MRRPTLARFAIAPLAITWSVAVLLACGSIAHAQEVDRARRPPLPPAPTFKSPDVSTRTLPNGLRLLVTEDHSLPLVAVRAVLGADSTLDPEGKEGLYALTVGALREGTTTKTPEQLAEAFADLGTAVTATAFTTTANGFADGLSLLGDMLMHPAFAPAGIERRKALQSAAARRIAQTPSTAPRHLFNALLYGARNGYVRSLTPSEASIASLTRDDVVHFYDAAVQPRSTTIVVSGDVTAATALAAVQRVFGGWQGGPSDARPSTSAAPAARPTTIYLHDDRSPQAYVYVGGAGPPRSAPDYAVAEVMGAIAGSRMTEVLRERRSFIYAGTAGLIARRAPSSSSFVGSAIVNVNKVDSALVEWLALLRGLPAQPVTAQELEATRRSRIGLLPARFEGPDSVATRIAELVRDDVPLDYYDRYVSTVATLTAPAIAAAAARYVDVDRLIIVVAGDRAVLEPALRAANIAPVVVVDANGNALP